MGGFFCTIRILLIITINIPEGLPIVVKDLAPFELITRHPILPSEAELDENLRSHSAKMRVIEKR